MDVATLKYPFKSERCITLEAINTISLRLKLNGEKAKIIFGIRSKESENAEI